jgi:hypothetical protein
LQGYDFRRVYGSSKIVLQRLFQEGTHEGEILKKRSGIYSFCALFLFTGQMIFMEEVNNGSPDKIFR